MVMHRKALMEEVSAAGLTTDQRKPPVACRFGIHNYSIRGQAGPTNQSVALTNQNRMMALLQQQQEFIDK